MPGHRLLEIALLDDDARDRAFPPGRLHTDALTGLDDPAGDRAGEAAKVEVRTVHPLHRQAERLLLQPVLVDLDGFEITHQRRAVVPRHVVARRGDVVAPERRHRDESDVLEADLRRERSIVLDDPEEDLFRVLDEVHLVDRDDDVADAEQRREVAVPARLRQHALARIDHQHGGVGGRGAGHHVARILLVAGRVGDDELALVGGEEAVGDIDRDALLALGGEAVNEQREIERFALRAVFLRIRCDGGELILEQHLRFIQQAANQRALAVIDAAASDEAQQAFLLMRLQILLDIGGDEIGDVGHQKVSRRAAPREASAPVGGSERM